MPVTIKQHLLKVKDGNTYVGIDALAETTTQEHVTAINDAGTAQIAAVQAQGATTIASIPQDYTTLSNNVSDLQSAFDVYGAANHAPVLNGTYRPGSFTVVADGIGNYTINGSSTGSGLTHCDIYNNASAFPSGFGAGDELFLVHDCANSNIIFRFYERVDGSNSEIANIPGYGTKTVKLSSNATGCVVRLSITNGTSYTNVVSKPLIMSTLTKQETNERVTALETIVDDIVENGESGTYNKISVSPVSGVMSKTGTITNVGQHASISVNSGEKYEIIAYKYGNDYPAYIFRKDGVIKSYSENANQVFHRWLVTVPDDVDEMIVNANTYLLYVAKFTKCTPMPYSKWEGKKIAWFGTSIPETSGYNPVLGYPEYVGELLGATVYNEAVGSSCARRGKRSAESETDPYGVTNMGVGALWSLGGTIAEKTDLTTNWESKWRAITGYNVDMTDAIKNKAIACSYENKLMQYVTTNPVDLYVFDHGYNDWRPDSSDNVANPDNQFDRSTYQGAMNTFISAILSVNPHANIVLISHYETQRHPGLIDMQESVAEYWGLPLIRICDKLGWAWDRTITSEGYWQSTSGGSVWVESGGTAQSYHLPELHMDDGLHPNKDLSGKACMDIGNVIAAELSLLPPNK